MFGSAVFNEAHTMSEQLFTKMMCERIVELEQETIEKLGREKANTFLTFQIDCSVITLEINLRYSRAEQSNLLNHHAWGLLKELEWLQFLFVAANYPLV